MSDNISNR